MCGISIELLFNFTYNSNSSCLTSDFHYCENSYIKRNFCKNKKNKNHFIILSSTMTSKPLINGKGVDKPFCSPFRNVKASLNEENKSNPNTPKSDSRKTPLRVSMSKRLVFQCISPAKKLCLNNENSEEPKNTEHNAELADKTCEALKNITEDTKLYRSDLDMLMKRINQKQQRVNDMETELNHKREKKTEELEAVIEKWTSACRRALIDYQNDLQDNHGQSISMPQIMSSLGIDKNLISFSDDTDTFQ